MQKQPMPKLQGVNHQRAVKAFQKAGFWIAREGKHITMTNGERIITIPKANPVDAFTMAGIVKDAGLTIEEFKRLLQVCKERIKISVDNKPLQRMR